MVQPPPRAKKPRVKKEPLPASENAEAGAGIRRSSRLRQAAENPKPKVEDTEDPFERELGEFTVNGECPKCKSVLQRGLKRHLEHCTGVPRSRTSGSSAAYRDLDKKLIAALPEEDRTDADKRMLARTKALKLNCLKEYDPKEKAVFWVTGSQGNNYVVTLCDKKHKCNCVEWSTGGGIMCKHLLMVETLLGMRDNRAAWRQAVEAKMDELPIIPKVEVEDGAKVPQSKAAKVAMNLL